MTAAQHDAEKNATDVQALIDNRPFGACQWLIFTLCFLVVLLDGFDTAAVGYIAPTLISEWGVERGALTPVLTAALFGLAGGALSGGLLADRFGRKVLLCVSVALFGSACLASAFAPDLQTLTILRFITGLGLGAAMPNAVTLMSEYCPGAQRATLTNAMFCGFPLGAALGGFLAAWMIPQFGWRSVLIAGGVAPLLLLPVLILLLPESVRYMVARQQPSARIRAALSRIAPQEARNASRFVLAEEKMQPGADRRNGAGVVLSAPYRLGSLMLWLAYFMGLLVFYGLINWLPTLLGDIGLTPAGSTLVAALFPLGGVGAIFAGWLMDRFNADRIVAIGYALTALSVWLIGQSMVSMGSLALMIFLSGIFMNTTQASMPALAAAFYPTTGRATGVAWMLGIGRFGGIAGSVLVAELASRESGLARVFGMVAMAALIAAAALLIKQISQNRLRDSQSTAAGAE